MECLVCCRGIDDVGGEPKVELVVGDHPVSGAFCEACLVELAAEEFVEVVTPRDVAEAASSPRA